MRISMRWKDDLLALDEEEAAGTSDWDELV